MQTNMVWRRCLLLDYLVKAEPGHRAYTELGVKAVFTGRRRSQGADRAELKILELDTSVTPFLVKINPLALWNFKQVQDYIAKNAVIYNRLLDEGYKSIGDYHSTVPSQNDEGERDGRWKGQEKTECGLHKDYFKMKAKLKLEASSNVFESHITGVCDIKSVFKSLKDNTAEISSISSLHYDQDYISMHLQAKEKISMPILKKSHPLNAQESTLYVATAIAPQSISIDNLISIIEILPHISQVVVLDGRAGIKVLKIRFRVDSTHFAQLNSTLIEFEKFSKIDIGIQKDDVFVRHKRLVIFDMDSTLIQQEVIDELAREAGVYSKIAAITESAM